MNTEPFRTTELQDAKEPAFVNGDAAASKKTLTSRRISALALDAAFRDRPDYFTPFGVEGGAAPGGQGCMTGCHG